MDEPMPSKKVNKAPPKPKYEHNGWSVLYRLVDGVLNLLNTNKIYPAFGLIFMSLAALIVWRIPETELAAILLIIVNEIIVSKSGIIVLFIVANVGWMYYLNRMEKMYEKEITRISTVRSNLMHKPGRVTIDEHRSSEGEVEESYLLSSTDETKGVK
jgi:hypothetical protein